MKRWTTMLLWLVAVVASANDGVFYVNGNQIVPVTNTDVAVTKEVLTISLCDDGYARVDVQYEFTNRGAAKAIDMGFEASAPYNSGESAIGAGGHPNIHDFTVTMNGQRLTYKTAVVAESPEGETTDFKPLDMKVWRLPRNHGDEEDWGNNLINSKTHESINYSVAYLFKGTFQQGKNTVHHTYRYQMSNGIMRTFEVPYWLVPAMRWANHQIDDFTLRIKAENTAKHFCLPAKLFAGAQWTVTAGKGKVRSTTHWDVLYTEVALRNGTVEWHKRNFRPTENFVIASADTYLDYDKAVLGSFYDRSQTYVPDWSGQPLSDSKKRILRNLPYAHRGYVFKDQKLQAYFNKFWWYMPDPTWKQDTSDFTTREWEFIKEGK